MPRLTGQPGRQSTPIFGPSWESHHSPVADRTMTARCNINSPDVVLPFDPVTNDHPTEPGEVLYTDIACRVQRVLRESVTADGQQQVTTRGYLIPVPYSIQDLHVDDVVTLTEASDPDLEGLRVIITDILKGSLRWERDLFCVENLG